MDPILFYGVPHGCSFGSIVALEWSNLPYRLARIDMLAKPAGYDRLYPTTQTPALLTEDGQMLGESLAILNHIAARDLRKKLGFAQGTPGFDRVNEALAFLHTEVHGAFGPVWSTFKLAIDDQGKDMLRAYGRDNVAHVLNRLDTRFAGRDWMAGEHRTVADAYLVGIVRWAEYLELFRLERDYPNLHRLVARLEQDPAVVFAHAIEEGEPAVTSGRFLGHVAIDEVAARLAA